MSNCCQVKLHVEESGGAALHVTEGGAASLKIGGSMYAVGPPRYEGPYEVTPSQSEQVLPTEGKHTLENIVVQPIPWYYGLITYNGSTITVS